MKLIKSASVYAAEVPTAALLAGHLAEIPFTDIKLNAESSIGFVEHDSGGFVKEFEGGMAFKVRIDDKIIPASAVTAEVNRVAKKEAQETGRKFGKKQRAEIKEAVLLAFRIKALTKTAIITCYHHTKTGYLIIPTTSRRYCDKITSILVHAVGSMKTETIHVSEVKHGLTTRLIDWFENGLNSFDEYEPYGDVKLSAGSEKMSISVASLISAREGLQVAIKQGFKVSSIGLTANNETSFRLSHDFKLSAIEFCFADPGEADDLWMHEAAVQVLNVASIVSDLSEMFAYKEKSE